MNRPISIIAVTYYTGQVLFDMLSAALAQEGVEDVILVNNGNPLPVFHKLEKLAEEQPRLKLISGQGNVGFAAACNRGVKAAKGEYLLFLNPDCVPPPGTALMFLEESKRLPRPHLIGARVVEQNGKEQSGSRRAVLTPWTAFVEVFGLYRFFPNHPHFRRFKWHEEAVPAETMPVPAVSGALMFTPREDYEKAGGFDEGYFLHVEDLDLCLSMRRVGGQVYFMPQPPVLHIGATSRVSATIVEWHKTRSFVRYFFKNYSDTYPAFALWIVSIAVWARFVVQGLLRLVIPRKGAAATP